MSKRLLMDGKNTISVPSKIVFKVMPGTTSLDYNISGYNITLKDVNGNILASNSDGGLPSISINQSSQEDVFTIDADKLNYVLFQGNSNLISILEFTIPSKLTIIESCFYGCNNLLDVRNISISESLKITRLFAGCSSLNHIDNFYVKDGAIAAYAFYDTSLIHNPIINCEKISNAGNLFASSQYFNDLASFQNKNLEWKDFTNFVNGTSINVIENLTLPNALYVNLFSSYNITAIKNIYAPSATSMTFSYNLNLTEISNVYVPNVKNLGSVFSNCHSLSIISNLTTGLINNLSSAFENCRSLTFAPQLNINPYLDNLSYLFSGCSNLSDITNIVSYINNYTGTNKLNCSSMFYGCTSITSLPNILFNKISDASSMFQLTGITSLNNISIDVLTPSNMFNKCSFLTDVTNVEFLNCKMANNIFSDCSNLEHISLIISSTEQDLNHEGNFAGCKKLTTCDLTITSTSNELILSNMFANCLTLTDVNITITNGQLFNASDMFYNCISLQSLPSINYEMITNSHQMFYNCINIYSVPALNLINSRNCSSMFRSCTKLHDVSSINAPLAIYSNSVFGECYSLVTVGDINLNSSEDIAGIFYSCSSLISTGNIYVNNAVYLSNIFTDCVSLIQIESLNASNAQHYTSAFFNCVNLVSIHINSPKAYYYSSCFFECRELTSVIIEPSDSSVENIYTTQMFKGCVKLSNLSMDLTKIYEPSEMFFNCVMYNDTLENITFNQFNGYKMFYNSGITGINNVTFNLSTTNNSSLSEAFSNCPNLLYATNITIVSPENVNSDASYLFGSSTNLSNISGLNISGNVGCRFLLNNTGITNLNLSLPNLSSESICDYMVSNNTNLTTISNLETGGRAETIVNSCPNLVTIDTIKNNSSYNGRSFIIENCDSVTTVNELHSNVIGEITIMVGSSLVSINKLYIPNCTSLKLQLPSIKTVSEVIGNNILFLDYFAQSTSLEDFPIMNTSSCTSFYSAFSGSAVSVYNSNYDLSNATSFQFMFANCSELTSVTINDTFKTTPSCDYMFLSCDKLTSVVFADASALRTYNSIFTDDSKVTNLVIPNFRCIMHIPPLITNVSTLESIINSAGIPANQYLNVITLGTTRLNSISTNVKNNAISKGWILQ